MAVAVRASWLCDDAYITFRTVDNLVSGYGPRWNTAERVQAFTHPLWMLLLAAVYAFTHEVFVTAQVLSLVITLATAVLIVLFLAESPSAAVAALAALAFSKAFVEYSTSGLENPLTHLLLAAFLAVFFSNRPDARKVLPLSLLAGLAALTRMDTLLLYLPALVYLTVKTRSWRGCLAAACGLLPFVAWEAFSLAYYGFPFPNTAYAKLNTGIADPELVRQGWHYLENSWRRDPLTTGTMAAGILAALLRGSGPAVASAFGVVLYVIYVIRIGGDFMTGRFFTPAFVCGAALVTGWTEAERARIGALARAGLGRLLDSAPRWAWAPVVAAIAWVGLGMPDWSGRDAASPAKAAMKEAWAAPVPTIYADSRTIRGLAGFKDTHGIGNERQFYFSEAGLLRYRRNLDLPTNRFAHEGKRYRLEGKPVVRTHGSVGFRGYFAGPKAHIIDYYALADPLLARLPACYSPNWRIGHFTRTIPPGYVETGQAMQLHPPDFQATTPLLAGSFRQWPLWSELRRIVTGRAAASRQDKPPTFAYDGNQIKDTQLAEYYDQLVLITRGPFCARERWAAIWRMNTGQFDHLIYRDAYRYPGILQVSLR